MAATEGYGTYVACPVSLFSPNMCWFSQYLSAVMLGVVAAAAQSTDMAETVARAICLRLMFILNIRLTCRCLDT